MSWLEQKRKQASLEENREMVRQHVRDGDLDQLSKAMLFAIVDRTYDLDGLKALCKSYRINVREEEWMMNKDEELKLLKEQQNALARRIEKLEFGRWGKEPANGTVFKIEKRFSSAGEKYVYSAIKADGKWYLTGTRGEATSPRTWEQLKLFAGKYSRVWKMTVAEELLD